MLPNYYDPDDDVLPKGSPLLQPVQVRIKLETPDGPADELDPEDLVSGYLHQTNTRTIYKVLVN